MRSGSASSSGAKTDPIRLTIRILLYDFQLIPAFCIMFVCMPLTRKELLAMRKKSAANPGGNDRDLALAAIYIIIITVILLMYLIPLYVVRHAKSFLTRSVIETFACMHDGYGMLNIVIYGIMNKKYLDFCAQRSMLGVDAGITPKSDHQMNVELLDNFCGSLYACQCTKETHHQLKK